MDRKPSRPHGLLVTAALSAILLARVAGLWGASPQEIREKLGVYIWGRVPDLALAVLDAKRLGADQVVRTFIGPWSDTPPYRSDLRPLWQKMSDPGYAACFQNFRVIMLTAYDSASYERAYGNSFTASQERRTGPSRDVEAELHHPSHPSLKISEDLSRMNAAEQRAFLSAVQEEFRRFASELSKMDRTFIVSNWEAENDVPETKYWPWLTRYLQARMDGIIAGRAEARQKGFPARVFTAFEFTIVPQFEGKSSGLVEIGSKLRGLDLWSYSSWWSIGSAMDTDELKHSFRYALELIRDYAKRRGLSQRVIIGEFGEYWNLHPDAERLRAVVDASIEGGAEYLFNWVLYEQPGEKDERGADASHVGKFSLDRSLTPQGRTFQKWFPAPRPTTPSP